MKIVKLAFKKIVNNGSGFEPIHRIFYTEFKKHFSSISSPKNGNFFKFSKKLKFHIFRGQMSQPKPMRVDKIRYPSLNYNIFSSIRNDNNSPIEMSALALTNLRSAAIACVMSLVFLKKCITRFSLEKNRGFSFRLLKMI